MTDRPALKASELMITARRLLVAFFQSVDADAGNQRDVTGHERQHARREKREYSRRKRNHDTK